MSEQTPQKPNLPKQEPVKVREDDLDFLDSLSQAALEQPTEKSSWLVYIIFFFVIAFIVWANWAQIDVLVRAEGKVIPSSQLQVVQSLEGGIVREILVKSGDPVKKGQTLLKLDATQFAGTYGENQVKQAALEAQIARLRAEATGTPLKLQVPKDAPELKDIFNNEIELYHKHQQQLETEQNILKAQIQQKTIELKDTQAQLKELQKSYKFIKKEIEINEKLVRRGYASEVDLLKLKREASQMRSQIETLKNTIPKLESEIQEVRSKLKASKQEFSNKAHEQLTKALAELAALQQTQAALADRVKRTALKSPVNGIVKRVLVTTVGGVIKPGDPVVEIVPEDDALIIEARVAPKDIGFLRPGQKAKVKFTAYDYAIYGGLEGVVDRISADTITDEEGNSYYIVRIRTNKSYLGSPKHPLPLVPGMIANVDIITGKHSVIHYLLKPIIKAKNYALTEG